MFLFKKKNQAERKETIIQNKTEPKGPADRNKEEENGEIEYEIVEKEILPEKMICPDCGGITLVGLEFCDKCGGELISRDSN